MYEDRLDGTVSDETWRRKLREWYKRQLEMLQAIERHKGASQLYFEAGVEVLKLAQRAYQL